MNTTYARQIPGETTEAKIKNLLEDLQFLYQTLISTEKSGSYLHLHALSDGNFIASTIDTREDWTTLHCLPSDQDQWEELIDTMASHNLSFPASYLQEASAAEDYIRAAIATVADITQN